MANFAIFLFFTPFSPLSFSHSPPSPPLACIFFLKVLQYNTKKRYKLIHNTTYREQMLNEKIDYAKYLTWFFENYPKSDKLTREHQKNDDFWAQFK